MLIAGVMLTGVTALAATPVLAATWDSIAVNDDMSTHGGDAGYGVGSGDSRADAEQEAMKQCRKANGGGCQVQVSYHHGCGAYASSRKYAGHGLGDTKEEARRAALSNCGDGACKVVVADCIGD
jgi:hypothetical protein